MTRNEFMFNFMQQFIFLNDIPEKHTFVIQNTGPLNYKVVLLNENNEPLFEGSFNAFKIDVKEFEKQQ